MQECTCRSDVGSWTGVVHLGKEDLNVSAGDQGVMFGYASDVFEGTSIQMTSGPGC